jgi:hypothetical protein
MSPKNVSKCTFLPKKQKGFQNKDVKHILKTQSKDTQFEYR